MLGAVALRLCLLSAVLSSVQAQELDPSAAGVKCRDCDGNQRIVCPACEGGKGVCSGCDEKSTQRCPEAGCENGITTCSMCNGRGMVIREERVGDKVRKSAVSCERCKGKKQNSCERCESGRVACVECGGEPKERCSYCENERAVVCARCDRFVGHTLRTIESCEEEVVQLVEAYNAYEDAREQASANWTSAREGIEANADSNLRTQLSAADETWARYGDAFVRLDALWPLVEGARAAAAVTFAKIPAVANQLRQPSPTQTQQLELRELSAVAGRYQRQLDSFKQLLRSADTLRADLEAKLQSIEGTQAARESEIQQKVAVEREVGLAFEAIRADLLQHAKRVGLPNATCQLVAARSTTSALIVALAYFDRKAERAPTAFEVTPTDAYLAELPELFDSAFENHSSLGRLRIGIDGLRAGRGTSGRMRIQSFFVGRTEWQRLRSGGGRPADDWSALLAELRPQPEFPRPGPGWVPIVLIVFFGVILLVSILMLCLTTDVLKSFG